MSISKLKGRVGLEGYASKMTNEALMIEPAEVFDIVLDESHDIYTNEFSIGVIRFKRLFTDKQKSETDLFTATPLNAGIKNYPIKHEIVLIVSAPNVKSEVIDQSTSFYYTDVVNVWGNVNHNALPYSTFPKEVVNQKDSDNRVTAFTGNMGGGDDIELGDYFVEKVKRPSLRPYEGDTVYEGRFGSSIRFSGTHIQSKNNWSSQGTDGDPIIIIRNDKKDSDVKWVTEDINSDASSIYVCDGQLIPLTPGYGDLKSFSSKPAAPSNYKNKQIILNSGRLFFNASEESVFVSAKKSISLAAKDTINIDFGSKFIVGNQSDAQKVVRGEDLVNLLNSLVFPSPMGPISFNSATQWISKQNGNSTLSKKSYIE